jgi:hypothetical protein
MPVDMPDDILKDAIVTAKKALDDCGNFEVPNLPVNFLRL